MSSASKNTPRPSDYLRTSSSTSTRHATKPRPVVIASPKTKRSPWQSARSGAASASAAA